MAFTFFTTLIQITIKLGNQKNQDDFMHLAVRYILIFLFGLSLSVNIFFYLKAVFGDPGVPESVYLYNSHLNEPCQAATDDKNLND